MNRLPAGVYHLILQSGKNICKMSHLTTLTLILDPSGIPIAYPRMVFLEKSLSSTFNPLTALGKTGSLGLSGFVNKFNADAELLDDLVRKS